MESPNDIERRRAELAALGRDGIHMSFAALKEKAWHRALDASRVLHDRTIPIQERFDYNTAVRRQQEALVVLLMESCSRRSGCQRIQGCCATWISTKRPSACWIGSTLLLPQVSNSILS
jgi:hypothetical protein